MDAIKKSAPVLIGIHSDPDIALENLLRMLKLNNHAKKLPIFLFSDTPESLAGDFAVPRKPGVTIFSTKADPVDVARQITITALKEKA